MQFVIVIGVFALFRKKIFLINNTFLKLIQYVKTVRNEYQQVPKSIHNTIKIFNTIYRNQIPKYLRNLTYSLTVTNKLPFKNYYGYIQFMRDIYVGVNSHT